ncbi:hypothetical protein [Roseovarius Plymouth podovirus 1]|uniref:Uncharacterized protein n=2 Tax=Roseovarius Plymouth podovirus 1 TaxID=926474 RepID=K4Q590_9CAUD|nr:hypothetical protein HYO70_gp07 [Roseovarius Plymouth podovirus 1]CBX87937.1 hypothetical protein [Roseovarius Plymouth podovirus 1]
MRKLEWFCYQRQLLMQSFIKMAQDITGSTEPRTWFPVYHRLYERNMK